MFGMSARRFPSCTSAPVKLRTSIWVAHFLREHSGLQCGAQLAAATAFTSSVGVGGGGGIPGVRGGRDVGQIHTGILPMLGRFVPAFWGCSRTSRGSTGTIGRSALIQQDAFETALALQQSRLWKRLLQPQLPTSQYLSTKFPLSHSPHKANTFPLLANSCNLQPCIGTPEFWSRKIAQLGLPHASKSEKELFVPGVLKGALKRQSISPMPRPFICLDGTMLERSDIVQRYGGPVSLSVQGMW